MTIRLHAGPKSKVLHILDRNDGDRRLAWTVCGIRFAWGAVDIHRWTMPRCEGCGSWS